MPATVAQLFDRYCEGTAFETRLAQAIATPRLLASSTMSELMPTVEKSDEPDSRWSRLGELDLLRRRFAQTLSRYPIGAGPIERMLGEGLAPAQIIERCRGADLQAVISPLYLRALVEHAAASSRGEEWPKAVWLARFACEAAVAWEPEAPLNSAMLETVLAYFAAAKYGLSRELDETIFAQTLDLGLVLLTRAEQQHAGEAIDRLCQAVGALLTDLWTVMGEREDGSPFELGDWLARPRRQQGLFSGLGTPRPIPEPAECLRGAVAWFQRALAYRTGYRRGLTYKSIVQTLHFLDVMLHEPIDEELIRRCMALAPELLRKHPDPTHLEVIQNIASARGSPTPEPAALESVDHALLETIVAATEPGDPADPGTERRRESHQAALLDLERAFRHQLPCVLYLRNFDYANDHHMLGEPINSERERTPSEGGGHEVHVVVPEISYSLVDHKLLQLFEEGVFSVCDPAIAPSHRETLIPMLSLRGSVWLPCVERLIQRIPRIVMLLDELTEGVQAELGLLGSLGAAHRTLILSGHAYRAGRTQVPSSVLESFPHVVDWIDFGFNESYHSQRYKAHAIIQPYLHRYVRANASPIVNAWLAGTSP